MPNEDDEFELDILAEQRVKLGKAPPWAHHIHDCLHITKRDLQQHRENTAQRAEVVDKQFSVLTYKADRILELVGEESDDGRGGQGLHGKLNRVNYRLESLEIERSRVRGALLAFGVAGGLITSVIVALGSNIWTTQQQTIVRNTGRIESNQSQVDRNTARLDALERPQ